MSQSETKPDDAKPPSGEKSTRRKSSKEVSFHKNVPPPRDSSNHGVTREPSNHGVTSGDILTDQELGDLKVAFDIFDYDKTGSIDPRKLGAVMKSLGHNPTEAEIQDLISAIDDDGNGTINYREFKKMMTPKMRESEKIEDVRDCFRVFDRDANGVITVDDLDGLFTRLGQKFTRHEMSDMLRAADMDGDKRVTFDDFLNVLKDS